MEDVGADGRRDVGHGAGLARVEGGEVADEALHAWAVDFGEGVAGMDDDGERVAGFGEGVGHRGAEARDVALDTGQVGDGGAGIEEDVHKYGNKGFGL